MKTQKMIAPAYWSRWLVLDKTGAELGRVERRGGFAPWCVLDASGQLVKTGVRTKKEALAALEPEDPA